MRTLGISFAMHLYHAIDGTDGSAGGSSRVECFESMDRCGNALAR